MDNENQFISDYSTNLAGTELFTPIVAAVGILCICAWGYYTTPPVEPEVIYRYVTWPNRIVAKTSLSDFTDLKTYAEALQFPNFKSLLSYNLYAHPLAINIFGPARGHTLRDLTVNKTITSHAEHLQSQFIASDLDPDFVNALESNTVAKLRQLQIPINTHPEGEKVLWTAESIKSPISQSLFNYAEQIEAFSADITQMYITLTWDNLPSLARTIRPNSLEELFKNVTTSMEDYPQNLINTWTDSTSIQDAALQIEFFSGLEPPVLVSLLTSVILIRAVFRLNLGALSYLEMQAINVLATGFRAFLGCVHPALLEASMIEPVFIHRNFSEELEKLSILHKTRKRKSHAYQFLSVWGLFNIEGYIRFWLIK